MILSGSATDPATAFTFQEAKDLCASLNSQLPDFRTEEQWDSLGKAYDACKFVHTHMFCHEKQNTGFSQLNILAKGFKLILILINNKRK